MRKCFLFRFTWTINANKKVVTDLCVVSVYVSFMLSGSFCLYNINGEWFSFDAGCKNKNTHSWRLSLCVVIRNERIKSTFARRRLSISFDFLCSFHPRAFFLPIQWFRLFPISYKYQMPSDISAVSWNSLGYWNGIHRLNAIHWREWKANDTAHKQKNKKKEVSQTTFEA